MGKIIDFIPPPPKPVATIEEHLACACGCVTFMVYRHALICPHCGTKLLFTDPTLKSL